MSHLIQTNVEASKDARRTRQMSQLSDCLDSVASRHGYSPINRAPVVLIRRTPLNDCFIVEVHGSSAVLRDVVVALDLQGFID